MYKFLLRNGQLVAFGLGVVVILLYFLMVRGGLTEFNALTTEEQRSSDLFNFGLYGAIFLTILCAIAMLGFGVAQMLTHFKSSVKGLAGLAVIILIFILTYSMADGTTQQCISANLSEGTCKYVSAAISTALTMLGLAVLLLVLFSLRNLFK